MPRYDFACDNGHVWEIYLSPVKRDAVDLGSYTQPCDVCGEPAKWRPSAQFQPEFKPFVHEHLGPEPVRVESREQYQRLLMRTDSYGPFVEPGSSQARTMTDMHEEAEAKGKKRDGQAA